MYINNGLTKHLNNININILEIKKFKENILQISKQISSNYLIIQYIINGWCFWSHKMFFEIFDNIFLYKFEPILEERMFALKSNNI